MILWVVGLVRVPAVDVTFAADACGPDRAPTAAQVGQHDHPVRAAPGRRAGRCRDGRTARSGEGLTRRLDALVTDPTGDDTEPGDSAAVDGDDTTDEEDVESVVVDIKAHPGNVSLNSLLDGISKLGQVRAVGVPAKAFTGIGVQVINAWRASASASSPSHLRRFTAPVRHVLLAAAAGDHRHPWRSAVVLVWRVEGG